MSQYEPGETTGYDGVVYTVEERLGGGPLGPVFACRDAWGNPRVLRLLRPLNRPYERVRETWGRTLETVRGLNGPGMVGLVDAFEAKGMLNLVLERCDHRLDQALGRADAPLEPRRVREIARQLLSTLERIHAAGHTHGSLHPRNVFCRVSLDGLAPGARLDGLLVLGDLETGMLLGQVDLFGARVARWLVPPEHLAPSEFGPLDQRLDVYQMGLLLTCLLRGRIVPYGYEKISTGVPARDALEIASGLGELGGFGPVLARALDPIVARRFATVRELWEALPAVEARRESVAV